MNLSEETIKIYEKLKEQLPNYNLAKLYKFKYDWQMLVKKAESLHSRDVRVPASMQTRSVDSILRLMIIKKLKLIAN